MPTPTSDTLFQGDHKGTTNPADPNLYSLADMAAAMGTDSLAISTTTSKVISTAAASALDSAPVSTASSKASSAASQASIADSKALSGSVNTSVADSKTLSVSGSASRADSKAVSVATATPTLTVVAASQSVSTADSKAVSVGSFVAPLPADGRTTTTLSDYLDNNAVFNVLDYGAVNDSDTNKSTANSTAIQAAVDAAADQGGGVVWFPASTGVTPLAYCINAPIIVPAGVHIIGEDRYTSIVKKVTATASTMSDDTQPVYQFPTSVGNPVCVFHFIESTGIGYSYGTVANITAAGDTEDASTTTTAYGFFFNGMSNASVTNCLAQYCLVGFFWGHVSTIASVISGNRANWCQRGFYQHFMTSTSYHSNYAVLSRYIGHDLSAYYSDISGNACDSGGMTGSGRAASTETFIAYKLYACRGVVFHGNGAETNNGAPLWIFGCISLAVRNNLFLEITSDHTASNLYALDMDTNYDLTVEDNRFVWATTKLSGAAISGTHFNYRVTGQNGYCVFRRNRFVDAATDVVDAGWTNTSGAAVHTAGFDDAYEERTVSPTATFDTPGNVAVTYGASNSMRVTRHGNRAFADVDLHITAMTFTTASGALRIGSLPWTADSGPPSSGSFSFASADLAYTSSATHITPSVVAGAAYITIANHKTIGATATTAVAQLTTGNGLRLQFTVAYRIAAGS